MNKRPSVGRRPSPNSRPSHHDRSASMPAEGRSRPPFAVRTRSSTPPINPQIMRQTNFTGKLHRGPVADSAAAEVCAVKRECGACIYVNTDYASGLRRKFEAGLNLLKEANVIGGAQILDPIPSPNTLGYRAAFKLAVRPATSQQKRRAEDNGMSRRFAIGLFEPGTHRIGVEMSSCPIHVQPLTWLLADLESEVELTALEPWNEQTNEGDLRYVAARASHVTNEIMITFVVTKPVKSELLKLVNKLRRMGHKIHAAFMNVNTSTGNAIFGDETIHVAGNTGLRESLCDLDFEISPMAFFQVNPWQASQLYRRVEMHAGRAKPSDVAWDLYSGTGQIALILGRAGFRTIGIEEVPEATADAKQNAQRNKLDSMVEFIAARVEDSETKLPAWSQNPQVIVVNPSRRGLHETARAHLAHVLRTNPTCKFIYVSCEATTMVRDLAALTAAGHRVRQVEAFDMFAQTDKLEWIAVLTK